MNQPLMEKNVYGLFARYVSLSVLSMTGLSLYVLADTFFVANGVGSDGLTALNLVLPLYSLINGSGLMLGMGAATHFSILTGGKDPEGGSRVFTHSLLLALALSVIFMIIGLFFATPLAVLLGAKDQIIPLSSVYLRTLLLFAPAFLINNIIVAFVRNDSSPNLAMCAMLLGSLCNILLDYVFIFPMNMGMFGAAFATGLAPIISLCILSLHFLRHRSRFRPIRCHITGKEVGRILSLGLPSFITECSSGVVMLLFNFTVLSLAGNAGVAAYGIIANLALICVGIFTGIAQGVQPLTSYCFGAGQRERIKTLLLAGLCLSLAAGLLFFLLGELFPGAIAAPFNRDGDSVLASIASRGIRIYFAAFPLMGINIVSAAFFASVGRPRQSFAVSLCRGLAAVIPLVLILPRLFGLSGVFSVVPCAELLTLLVSGGCLIIYLKRETRRP